MAWKVIWIIWIQVPEMFIFFFFFLAQSFQLWESILKKESGHSQSFMYKNIDYGIIYRSGNAEGWV